MFSHSEGYQLALATLLLVTNIKFHQKFGPVVHSDSHVFQAVPVMRCRHLAGDTWVCGHTDLEFEELSSYY